MQAPLFNTVGVGHVKHEEAEEQVAHEEEHNTHCKEGKSANYPAGQAVTHPIPFKNEPVGHEVQTCGLVQFTQGATQFKHIPLLKN